MVRNKDISLPRGAELLKMPLQDFLELASENHISVLDYESEKVEQNLSALKKAFSKAKVYNNYPKRRNYHAKTIKPMVL